MMRFDMKTHFFDRPVVDAMKNAGRKILSKLGAYTRRTSRGSIKQAKRKTPAELSTEERERLNKRMRQWAAGRLANKPQPPYRSSQPGTPPVARGQKSAIKRILFAYDPAEQSVVIGFDAYGKRPGVATEALEYSGAVTNQAGRRVNIAARPTITPAFQKHLPLLTQWRNAL